MQDNPQVSDTKIHITKMEYERLAAFRYALRSFLRFSEKAAEANHITSHQYQALLAIKGRQRERLTIGELADQLQIRSHSAVELVDRMVAQGLVVRQPSADDRRQVCVVLTAHGEEVLSQLAAVHKEQLRVIGPELERLIAHLSSASDQDASDIDEKL